MGKERDRKRLETPKLGNQVRTERERELLKKEREGRREGKEK